jgi:hypothetical protein
MIHIRCIFVHADCLPRKPTRSRKENGSGDPFFFLDLAGYPQIETDVNALVKEKEKSIAETDAFISSMKNN